MIRPPYSPKVNPAEWVFEEIRRRVESRKRPTIDDKVRAVMDCLGRLESDPARVTALT